MRKFSLEDLRQFAQAAGGDLLSVDYVGALQPYYWRCPCGGSVSATKGQIALKIRAGEGWCADCTRRRHAERARAGLRARGEARGLQLLDTEYFGPDHLYRFFCSFCRTEHQRDARIELKYSCKARADIATGNANRGSMPRETARKNRVQILTPDEDYRNERTRVECLCDVCGFRWTATAKKLRLGRKCLRCTNQLGHGAARPPQ